MKEKLAGDSRRTLQQLSISLKDRRLERDVQRVVAHTLVLSACGVAGAGHRKR